MELSMASLGMGVLTAFLFGFMLWGFYYVIGFACALLFGLQAGKKRCGRVGKELLSGAYVLFCSLATVLFLYYINRGIFRWFLCFAILASYCLASRLIGRRIKKPTERLADRVRRLTGRLLRMLCYPLYITGRFILRLSLGIVYKISLRIGRKYGRLLVRKYDRKRRRRLPVSVQREMARMLSADVRK